MTKEKAAALADLIAELATDIAYTEVCRAAGDYDTRGDASGIKARIVLLLTDSEDK